MNFTILTLDELDTINGGGLSWKQAVGIWGIICTAGQATYDSARGAWEGAKEGVDEGSWD